MYFFGMVDLHSEPPIYSKNLLKGYILTVMVIQKHWQKSILIWKVSFCKRLSHKPPLCLPESHECTVCDKFIKTKT